MLIATCSRPLTRIGLLPAITRISGPALARQLDSLQCRSALTLASRLVWPARRPWAVASFAQRRTYISDQRDPSDRRPHYRPTNSPVPWLKPALYTAGGIALVVVAWPMIRLVILGGIGFAFYRGFRMLMIAHEINRVLHESGMHGSSGKGPLGDIVSYIRQTIEQMAPFSIFSSTRPSATMLRSLAEDAVLAAYEVDPQVHDLIGASVTVSLGDALEFSSSEAVSSVSGKQRTDMEAVFPVFADNQATHVFLRVTGQVEDVVKGARVWLLARTANNQIVELELDVLEDSQTTGRSETRAKRRVQDADFRDLD